MSNVKERKLSEKEQKRLERMNEITKERMDQGYRRRDQIISISYANVMAVVLSVPFDIVFGAWFVLRNGWVNWLSIAESGILLVALVGLVVVHEWIHGIVWGRFAAHKFKSIEFGFLKETLTAYCTCSEPLRKWQYVIGTLMPSILLGMIPAVVGVLANSLLLLLIGLMMIMGGGGDLTIAWKLLTDRTDKKEVIIMDHPTECGYIVFER